jgi:hypothetical protein
MQSYNSVRNLLNNTFWVSNSQNTRNKLIQIIFPVGLTLNDKFAYMGYALLLDPTPYYYYPQTNFFDIQIGVDGKLYVPITNSMFISEKEIRFADGNVWTRVTNIPPNTSVDYLDVNYNDKLNLSNTDYTIEFWVRFFGISGSPIFLTTSIAVDFNWQLRLENNALKLKSFLGEVSANWIPVVDQWYHIAVVRSGSSTNLYIDGQQLASSNLNPINNNTNSLKIGGRGDGASLFGNIDELRITKGIARYTSNFIPQTAPFPNQ